MEVTKWLKPSDSGSRIGDRASVQAATRVNAEQALYGVYFVKLNSASTTLLRVPSSSEMTEGSSPLGAGYRVTTLYSVDPLGSTMMQPCASTAKLRAAGPISKAAFKPWLATGHRHLGSSSAVRRS